jgi:hypothetical protein
MSTVHKKTLNNLQLLMLKFNFVIEYKKGWRNTVCQHIEEQKKRKRRNKILQTRTTERLRVERS